MWSLCSGESDLCRGYGRKRGQSKRFSRAKTGELAKKDKSKAKPWRNGEQSKGGRAKRAARARERTTLRAERRALRVVRVRQCAALHHVLRKLRESLRERWSTPWMTEIHERAAAVCHALSSLDAAVVTRRRRRMASFAFPSGGAPSGASLHLRRPLRRRRPGAEYADCTNGSDCADCGPSVPRPPPPRARTASE